MTDRLSRISLPSLLALDAASCAALGGLLLALSPTVAGLTSLPQPLLIDAGVILLLVAGFIGFWARRSDLPGWAASLIIGGNLLWVLGSLFLPLAGLVSPSPVGWVFLLGQAGAVALLTALEWRALPVRGLA